jgi:RNA polymerase sigma factor (sigma-70 family)
MLTDAFDAHGQGIYAFCLRRCGDRDLAEDLMSAVFLEAWRSRRRAFVVEASLAPWLFGVAANLVRNRWRSMRRHEEALKRYRHSLLAEESVHPDHADAVAAQLSRPYLQDALTAAMARLSRKDRDVVELCLCHGLSTQAAAAALGLPHGTVKSRLAHARAALRALLQPAEPDHQSDLVPAVRSCTG